MVGWASFCPYHYLRCPSRKLDLPAAASIISSIAHHLHPSSCLAWRLCSQAGSWQGTTGNSMLLRHDFRSIAQGRHGGHSTETGPELRYQILASNLHRPWPIFPTIWPSLWTRQSRTKYTVDEVIFALTKSPLKISLLPFSNRPSLPNLFASLLSVQTTCPCEKHSSIPVKPKQDVKT
jgi:hypothetical protein